MSGFLGFLKQSVSDGLAPGATRKRKRSEDTKTESGRGPERKARKTSDEVDLQSEQPGFFTSLLAPFKNFFSQITQTTLEEPTIDEPRPKNAPGKDKPLPLRVAPRFLIGQDEATQSPPSSSNTPFVLPTRRHIPQERRFDHLVEASPFVSSTFSYGIKERNTVADSPGALGKRTSLSRSTENQTFNSPFRFSFSPPKIRTPAPLVKPTTSPSARSTPGKTRLEQMEVNDQAARWENMLSSVDEDYDNQPEQRLLRQQQEKYRAQQARRQSDFDPANLSFEYVERPATRRTVQVRDHDYELAKAEERRRAQAKIKELTKRTKEPPAWPQFRVPLDFSEGVDDLGLGSLFKEEGEEYEEEEEYEEDETRLWGEKEYERDLEEEDEALEEGARWGVQRNYYSPSPAKSTRFPTWKGDFLKEEFHADSDWEIADEFYDVDVDEIDMNAALRELHLKKLIARRIMEEEKRMYRYGESEEARKARIEDTKQQLRKLAKQQKKEMRRKMEEQRKREELERRKNHVFSNEELAIISRTLKGRDAEIVISAFNADLKKSDIRRLRDTEWLNDEVINFYMELLKERNAQLGQEAPKCHFFNTFFYPLLMDNGNYNYPRVRGWTRRIDIFSMDKVVVPVHLGNHWCLAVINFKDKRFEYYDSLGSSNNTCIKTLRRYLADESRDKKKTEIDLSDWRDYQPKDIPLQKNGYDCGVFACKYADCISAGHPFLFKQVHMPYFRQLMILEIVQKRCSPISY